MKHLEKCEKKKRYEMLEINPELYANMNLLCNRLYSKKFNNPETNKKLFMANEKNFKKVNDFTDYCLKVGVYSQQDFLMYLLANGVKTAIAKDGLLGVFTGGTVAGAGGIAAAIFFGYIMAVVFTPKAKP